MEQVLIRPDYEFSLYKTMMCGQVFYFDKLTPNKFRLYHRDKSVMVEQLESGELLFDCGMSDVSEIWEDYLQYNTYYGQAFAYCLSNKYLTEAYEASKGLRILKQNPWDATLGFIVSQNNNISKIKSTLRQLVEFVSKEVHIDEHGNNYKSLPTPEEIISRGDLRHVGLGYRDEYLYSMARNVYFREIELESLVSPNSTPNDVINLLMTFRGIGKKVASCIALFGLGYLDSYPIDRWIQRYQDTYLGGKTPDPTECSQLGVVQQYMFYESMVKRGSV